MKVNGYWHYLWRAEDQKGEVLESLLTKSRYKKTELQFLKKAMQKHGRPAAIMTDKLCYYGAAPKELGANDRQEMGRRANNRAENSHLASRRRKRAMLRFRRMWSFPKCASVQNHQSQERRPSKRSLFRAHRAAAFFEWRGFHAG